MGNWCATIALAILGGYYVKIAIKEDSGPSRVVGVICGMALIGGACFNFALGIGVVSL